jgi:hypothetical protein
MLCHNVDFWKWCNAHRPDNSYATVMSADDATSWMRQRLGIDSRKDLDTMDAKAKLYHDLVRRPFVAWQGISEEA